MTIKQDIIQKSHSLGFQYKFSTWIELFDEKTLVFQPCHYWMLLFVESQYNNIKYITLSNYRHFIRYKCDLNETVTDIIMSTFNLDILLEHPVFWVIEYIKDSSVSLSGSFFVFLKDIQLYKKKYYRTLNFISKKYVPYIHMPFTVSCDKVVDEFYKDKNYNYNSSNRKHFYYPVKLRNTEEIVHNGLNPFLDSHKRKNLGSHTHGVSLFTNWNYTIDYAFRMFKSPFAIVVYSLEFKLWNDISNDYSFYDISLNKKKTSKIISKSLYGMKTRADDYEYIYANIPNTLNFQLEIKNIFKLKLFDSNILGVVLFF